jgi:hypothetical protein
MGKAGKQRLGPAPLRRLQVWIRCLRAGRYRVELANSLPGEDALGALAGLPPLTWTYQDPAVARQAGERWRRYYGVAAPLKWAPRGSRATDDHCPAH